VTGPVDFEDDTLAVGQQEQEVHPVSQQGVPPALADGLGVPSAAIPRAAGREACHRAAVDLVIQVVEVPLGRRVSRKAAKEPLIQGALGLPSSAMCRVPFHHACKSRQRTPSVPMGRS
jgi:hypothetical protein